MLKTNPKKNTIKTQGKKVEGELSSLALSPFQNVCNLKLQTKCKSSDTE